MSTPIALHCTIVCGESISLRVDRVDFEEIGDRSPMAPVISLAEERAKRACDECGGTGRQTGMIETEYGPSHLWRTCEKCNGKGRS